MSQQKKTIAITVRRHTWNFDRVTGPFWYSGSPAMSHWFDAYTLLVPDNEVYYIRTLRPCMDMIDDQMQKAELLEFFRQESLHGIGHKAYRKTLDKFGLKFEPFVRSTGWLLYDLLEPLQPHRIRVSIVAAVEHINAFLANIVLEHNLMRGAVPEVRELFYWHFVEEIEHKAVAHNALMVCYPGYITRTLGAVLAFPTFFVLSFIGMAYLLLQEGQLFRRRTIYDLFRFWIGDGVLRASLHHIARYFRPSFDPWEVDDLPLAREFSLSIQDKGARVDLEMPCEVGQEPAAYQGQPQSCRTVHLKRKT